jgi:hypothetical protein
MARATWLAGAAAVAAASLCGWLYADNRALRAELAARPAAVAAPAVAAVAPVAPVTPAPSRAAVPALRAPTPPALPDAPHETRMERRQRRTEELGQMFGRLDGESEADYKARVMPMISAGLIAPRLKLEEARRLAQERAHVTPAQAQKLDQAFDKIYGDVLDYTNKAIADGQLSPYERNVAGWLDYAGGLGGILGDANGQIAKILEPAQIRAMADAGFEWGEYLGVKAPWEQLAAPPPRKP